MGHSHLIILPCHSIWTPGSSLGQTRSEWKLASFQYAGYDHLCFKEHIENCIKVLEEDKEALLIISGGQTDRKSGPVSESLSYYQLARNLIKNELLLERVNTEEFARDSFENTIFLICRFFEIEKRYPDKITVVGFEFKKNRFLNLHLGQALGFNNTFYVGNMPTPIDLDEEEKKKYFDDLERSEYDDSVQHFERDWYGRFPPLLDKKIKRNPFQQQHGYIQSNLQLKDFLQAVRDDANKNDSSKKLTNEEVRSLLLKF